MSASRRILLGAAVTAVLAAVVVAVLLVRPFGAATVPSSIVPIPAYAEPEGAAAHQAAKAFLATLDAAQAGQIVYPLDSPLRPNWSNLPAGVTRFERNGLRIGDLNADQAAALFAFLGAALSRHGYETMAEVVTADAVLADALLARTLGWSADNYWIAFFGTPTATGAWGWQFGGHHLAINGSFAEGRMTSLSPTFMGVEPSSYTFNGVAAQPLAAAFGAGLAVVGALPGTMRETVLLADRPDEEIAGAGRDGVIPDLAGSAVAHWPAEARTRLLIAIAYWVRMQPAESAERRMTEIEASLDAMRFGWHGAMDGSGPIYFRVQGPSLIIEFSTEQGVGAGDGHYHSVYRDPTNEYGRAG